MVNSINGRGISLGHYRGADGTINLAYIQDGVLHAVVTDVDRVELHSAAGTFLAEGIRARDNYLRVERKALQSKVLQRFRTDRVEGVDEPFKGRRLDITA